MPPKNFNQTNLRLPMRVWDLPIRLFHWIIVLLIIFSYVSVNNNWMQLHVLSGYTILTLLLFRVVWGFIGSDTARFAKFLKSPIAGLRHLAQFGRRAPDDEIGHNEAGGWMVLAMLVVLAVQVGTGLFANDDGSTYGPLEKYVGKDVSDRISDIHGLNFDVLLTLICLHILAIAAYAVVKRHDLVRPMFTGKKKLPAATRAPRMRSPVLALVILAAAAAAVWLVVNKA